jgi:hypothetical protein
MSRTRSQEITGPGGSRRVQKPKKYGPKPRNHGSTAELERKSHQNHTKNTVPMSQKHHQTKTPYFEVGRLRRTVIFRLRTSLRFRDEICQKKFRRFAANYFFVARQGRVGTRSENNLVTHAANKFFQ